MYKRQPRGCARPGQGGPGSGQLGRRDEGHRRLDPALSLVGLRSWENGGPFYDVPILNFAGWFVTGIITSLILHIIWGKDDDVQRSIAYSGFAIIWFWAGVNLGLEQWLPGGIGLAIGLIFLILMIIEKRRRAKEKPD